MIDKTSVDKILAELGLKDREVTTVYSSTSDSKGIKESLAIFWKYKEDKGSSILFCRIDIKNGETYKQAFHRTYGSFNNIGG